MGWLLASLKRVHQLVTEVLSGAWAVDGEHVVLLRIEHANLRVLRLVLRCRDVAVEHAVSKAKAKTVGGHVLGREDTTTWSKGPGASDRRVLASLGSLGLQVALGTQPRASLQGVRIEEGAVSRVLVVISVFRPSSAVAELVGASGARGVGQARSSRAHVLLEGVEGGVGVECLCGIPIVKAAHACTCSTTGRRGGKSWHSRATTSRSVMGHDPSRGERRESELLVASDCSLRMASTRLLALAQVVVRQERLLVLEGIVSRLDRREVLATGLLPAMVLLLLVILLQLMDLGRLRKI